MNIDGKKTDSSLTIGTKIRCLQDGWDRHGDVIMVVAGNLSWAKLMVGNGFYEKVATNCR